MPRMSVVIACYNAASTLPETIASLQRQTMQEWEAICIDDGSSDDTLRLLTEIAGMDERIRVITQANAGPSSARNKGVALARATWIAFLDADDLWLPEKLAEVANVADTNPEAAAIYGKIAFWDPSSGRDTTYSSVKPGRTNLIDLMGENPVCTLSNLSVRRDVFYDVGGFREDMRYSEDLELLIRLAAAEKLIIGTTDLHVRYRASVGGLSADLKQMHHGWRQAIQSAGTALPHKAAARAESIHLRYLARRALRLNGGATEARRLALRGMSLDRRAFLGGGHRGPLTFVSCLLSPFIPAPLRRRLFA